MFKINNSILETKKDVLLTKIYYYELRESPDKKKNTYRKLVLKWLRGLLDKYSEQR